MHELPAPPALSQKRYTAAMRYATDRSILSSAHMGTLLAFDFGTQRIGVAVGDSKIGIAHPLTAIHAEDKRSRYAAIEALITEWQPALLVVGLPLQLDGTEHEMTRLARKFSRELGGRFQLPVELIDERLTSADADSLLADGGANLRDRKELVDQFAARQILQDYLDRSVQR